MKLDDILSDIRHRKERVFLLVSLSLKFDLNFVYGFCLVFPSFQLLFVWFPIVAENSSFPVLFAFQFTPHKRNTVNLRRYGE